MARTLQQAADWIGRVVHRPADVELDPTLGEFVDDVAGVGQGSGQPIELGHDQRVPFPARGKGLTQSGLRPVGPSETVINVDAFRGDAER